MSDIWLSIIERASTHGLHFSTSSKDILYAPCCWGLERVSLLSLATGFWKLTMLGCILFLQREKKRSFCYMFMYVTKFKGFSLVPFHHGYKVLYMFPFRVLMQPLVRISFWPLVTSSEQLPSFTCTSETLFKFIYFVMCVWTSNSFIVNFPFISTISCSMLSSTRNSVACDTCLWYMPGTVS